MGNYQIRGETVLYQLFWSYCSFDSGSFSKMACSIGCSGDSKVTRVLFCGPYFPASTIYTKEYLQSYPFIEVG
jgi:hypothetical protein